MTNVRSIDVCGAEIQYFRLEPRYWDEMLRRFKDTGLRCVSSYMPWETHCVGEPTARHPAGVLDFEGRTDPRRNLRRYLELVEKHGLLLNARPGPFVCNEMDHGGLPRWLVMSEPAMMSWDYQNRPTQGYWIIRQEGSQPSYLHPRYLALVSQWFAAVDRVLAPHLCGNGGCVTMLSLDNEISYIVRDAFLLSDYNPMNVKPGGLYHQFLEGKYGSAARMPYASMNGLAGNGRARKFSHIDQVAAPRQVPLALEEDLPYYLDWVEFKQWTMCEYLRRLRRMHEANGIRGLNGKSARLAPGAGAGAGAERESPTGVRFNTNFNPHLPEGVPTRMPAFQEAVGEGGLVGYDFYRGTFMSYSGYHSMARVLKLMNASVGYTWSAEFMSGTWEKVLNSRVSEDHMRFMARCALAQGCKAIQWFMFHDRDTWGDCPVSGHGHVRPSLAVLRETAELVGHTVADWDDLHPRGDVAVIYDLLQHRHTSLGDPMPCDDNNLHLGKPTIDGVKAGAASAEYVGLFRLIEETGVQPDVVDILQDGGRLSRYPLAFLPGSPVLESSASARLRRYVSAGGTLVVSGPWPGRDERGRGLRFLGVKAPKAPVGRGLAPVTIKIGKGKVVWFSSWLTEDDQPEAEDLAHVAAVDRLVRAHVKTPAVRVRPVEEVSWRDGGKGLVEQPRNLGSAVLHTSARKGAALLYVLNHYPEAVLFEVTLGGREYKSLTDLDSGATIPLRRGRARVDVDRKSACIYRVNA